MRLQHLDSSRKFGTAPVFLTAISTILGAVMFLRFGYAVGNLGLLGTLGVILLGHLVTIPTAMAIAEIATNQRVQGGGEYYIISRSFGNLIGAAVGVALYLSQAISVAFYIIAFGQAFRPVFEIMQAEWSVGPLDPRLVTVPATILLAVLILTKGADLGVKALYVVVAVLFASLACFFLGRPTGDVATGGLHSLVQTIAEPAGFFTVFAICFPAFTGMTAGVGLSGDLKDPRRSIPLGTLGATITGMLVYTAIAWKLSVSATPDQLVGDELIMSRIAIWGPIIPIGLACATISSALGSILVAPRTLQALANDRVFPSEGINHWLALGRPGTNEPTRATLVTSLIALAFVLVGDVDFVAQIISMIFMVTYGSLCMVSFLQHFAADPSYRPLFRSRWYISLFGAVMCLWLMFGMSPFYAALSLALLAIVYVVISLNHPEMKGLATLLMEAFFQISRKLQVFLQQSRGGEDYDNWRPSVVCVSHATFERRDAFDLLRWISHRYGFGTYIHYVEGYLSRKTLTDAREMLTRLVRLVDASEGNVYVDTLVCPSYTSAIAQLVQLPGIAGRENNMILLEYRKNKPEALKAIVENLPMIMATDFQVCVLASSPRGFGYERELHIWLRPGDFDNAGLMILLAYVILGHPDWRRATVRVFALFPEEHREEQEANLLELIRKGRIPISPQNVEFVPLDPETDYKEVICGRSIDADLTILGFQAAYLKRSGGELLAGFEQLGNILWVTTTREIELAADEEAEQAEAEPVEETTDEPAADEVLAEDETAPPAASRAEDGAARPAR